MLKKILMSLTVFAYIAAASTVSYAMSCCADGDHAQHKQLAQAAPSKEAVNVGNKICPVTGQKIDEKTKVTYEYQGKIYNFCCAGCPDIFKKDPAKYIAKVNEELRAK